MKRDLRTSLLFISLVSAGIIGAQELKQSLLSAIREGKVKEVRNLVKKGAQVDVKRGAKPLVVASRVAKEDNDQKMAKITKELLRKGANPATRGIGGRTPLLWAANNGAYKVLKELLRTEEGKATINMKGRGGNTALILATTAKVTPKKRLEMVKKLLNKKADPNIKNRKGKTALFYARQEDDTEVINLLLKHMENESIREPIKPRPPMTTLPVPINRRPAPYIR